MRIGNFLLFGLIILVAAVSTDSIETTRRTTDLKQSKGVNEKRSLSAPQTVTVGDSTKSNRNAAKTKSTATATTTTTASKTTASRQSKDIKIRKDNEENRGKRTLFNFGNAGENFFYPNGANAPSFSAANRRSDYEGRAFYPLNDGRFYGEPNSLGHFPSDLGVSYSHFPQYLEAPEPIIEIIIKDSNETLPINTTPLPPKKKKKKEKVQVFYVNYKKDANNKLHLETPIASLNNDDEEDVRDAEEENERHIDYPSGVVTPPTPLRTTTLRTVIHPDSEKYHSNGGIRVSFGSEDKSQTGHSLEEADAESVQRQVVAVPVPASSNAHRGDPFSGFNSLTESYFANQRTIDEQKRLHAASGSSAQSQTQTYYHADQQLPAHQTNNYFRSPYTSLTAGGASATTPHFFPKQDVAPTPAPQPHFYRKQQQQQQQQAPTFGTSTKSLSHSQQQQQASKALPQPQAQTQPLPRKATSAAQPSRQQSHYYVNFNQQYPQQKQATQQQNNQQQANQHLQHSAGFSHNYQYNSKRQQQQTTASAAAIFAPTALPKVQDLPFRQSLAPYQPIKFRPTPPPTNQIKSVAIPAKLENSHYQQAAHHQHHHNQQQVVPQKQQKQQYYTQQQYPQQQQHQQHYTFNHQQQQFVQTLPTFNQQQPLQQQSVYFKKQQQHHQQQQQQPQQSQFNGGQKTYHQYNSNVLPQNQVIRHEQVQYQQQQQQQHQQYQLSHQQLSSSLNNLHTALKAQPSKETELLQSVPKYEQHITETIHQQQQKALQQQQQQQQQQQVTNTYKEFNYPQNNQVIHDIPAPNLGPSGPQQHQQEPQQQKQQYLYQTQQYQQQQYQTQPQQQQHYHQHTSAQSAGSSSAGQQQEYTNFVTTTRSNSNNNNNQLFSSSTPAPEYELTTDGRKIMIVTPIPPTNTGYNHYASNDYQQQQRFGQQSQQQNVQYQQQQSPSSQSSSNSPWTNNFSQQQQHSVAPTNFGVSTFHANAFQELDKRKHTILHESRPQEEDQQQQQQPRNTYSPAGTGAGTAPGSAAGSAGTVSGSVAGSAAESASPSKSSSQSQVSNDAKVSKTLLELPEEVPEDLRQHLISSGILGNAQISVLDYDKVGDVALENLPAEHLQHFYGAGGGAQISESKKVLTVVKPNGENVRKQTTKSLPEKQKLDVKIVRFDENNERTVTQNHVRANATIVPPVDIADRQYNRYLPIKINGAQFPLPDAEELKDKKVVSVVVLAPVEAQPYDTFDPNSDALGKTDARSHRDAADGREVKFLGGDLIRVLLKKPTKENYKRWLEKEARTDVDQQAVVLLVATPTRTPGEQEIFMYDIVSGAVNKLNGELSSAFVSVAEENVSSEDLEHASTLDPVDVENMMQKRRR